MDGNIRDLAGIGIGMGGPADSIMDGEGIGTRGGGSRLFINLPSTGVYPLRGRVGY